MDRERTLPFRSRKKTAEAMVVLLVWIEAAIYWKDLLRGSWLVMS